jgi:hypothetical protein
LDDAVAGPSSSGRQVYRAIRSVTASGVVRRRCADWSWVTMRLVTNLYEISMAGSYLRRRWIEPATFSLVAGL